MTLPFEGAISAFYNNDEPDAVRDTIKNARKGKILSSDFPYDKKLNREEYESDMAALQVELVKIQAWIKETGQRIAIVFEGRDAAGKGGTIKRFRENLNPRIARVVALSKPSDREAGEWYFQRYTRQLPSAGEIVFFDRSWYNRGVVEHVFDFCTPDQRERWFAQTPAFEKMLTDDGVHVFKLWLNVGRAEQLRRILAREGDPLKQWKLCWIAIAETLERTHTDHAPWTTIRTDDKRRARLNAIRTVLHGLDYDDRDAKALDKVDPQIAGGPDLWHA